MNLVFMGSPDFSREHLNALLAFPMEFCVKAVYTQPDRPQGRSAKPSPTPVKTLALEHALPVIQVSSFKDENTLKTLLSFAPDFLIVVAYGIILPASVLAILKYGAINIHTSLLPKYRGASPIHQTLLNGDSETGVTSMLLDPGIDTGNILMQKKFSLSLQDDYASLLKTFSKLGPECLLETLYYLRSTDFKFHGTLQSKDSTSYTRKITKEMAFLDFSKSALTLHNQIRALNLWPVCHIKLPIHGNLKVLKIFKSEPISHCPLCSQASPGVLSLCTRDQIHIKTAQGCLSLLEVQLEGKKRMPAAAFLNGFPLHVGDTVTG
jgi:methionyl-tRNA formyltransferase